MKRNIKTFNRYFSVILYEEDPRFNELMQQIQKNYTEITYVDHDRDIDEEGKIKKKHRHIIFKVGENARSVTTIAEELNYTRALIEGCNHEAMLLYLLHKNNPEKTQYKLEEVKGETGKLKRLLLKTKPEDTKIVDIVNKICEGKIQSVAGLLYYACNNECLEEVKRMQFMLYKIIEEKYKNNVDK